MNGPWIGQLLLTSRMLLLGRLSRNSSEENGTRRIRSGVLGGDRLMTPVAFLK